MDNSERKAFWDTLISLKGDNIDEDSKKLAPLIKPPSLLYRFRPLNVDTLSALANNKMFFSTANHYDDPFDTFFYINWGLIGSIFTQVMDFVSSKENMERLRRQLQLPDTAMQTAAYKAEHKEQTKNEVREILDEARENLQKHMASICFSEDIYNESLWLKYADQYRGFALEYSTDDLLANNYFYSNSNHCKGRFGIYPVYYTRDSEEKFDATDIVEYTMCQRMLASCCPPVPEPWRPTLLRARLNPWRLTAVGLIKHMWHEYDQEWRIIPRMMADDRERFYLQHVPISITLGLRMKDHEQDFVAHCARQAGIRNIRRCCIVDGELKVEEVE